jgi:hypothetical protein
MWTLFLLLYYLHNCVDQAKGVGVFVKVFGEAGREAIVPKVLFVFIVPYGEFSDGLTYMCHVAVWVDEFVHS